MKKLLIGCVLALALVGCSEVGEIERPAVHGQGVIITDTWRVGRGDSIRRVVLKKYGRVCYLFRWDGIWCERGYE